MRRLFVLIALFSIAAFLLNSETVSACGGKEKCEGKTKKKTEYYEKKTGHSSHKEYYKNHGTAKKSNGEYNKKDYNKEKNKEYKKSGSSKLTQNDATETHIKKEKATKSADYNYSKGVTSEEYAKKKTEYREKKAEHSYPKEYEKHKATQKPYAKTYAEERKDKKFKDYNSDDLTEPGEEK